MKDRQLSSANCMYAESHDREAAKWIHCIRYQKIYAETQLQNMLVRMTFQWFCCSENYWFLKSFALNVFGRKISSSHIGIISYSQQMIEFTIDCCLLVLEQVGPVVVSVKFGSTYAGVSFDASQKTLVVQQIFHNYFCPFSSIIRRSLSLPPLPALSLHLVPFPSLSHSLTFSPPRHSHSFS